jgi:hypothetical protein
LGKLATTLSFISKYIHECIKENKLLLEGNTKFTSPKTFLYQMYFIINKLDEHRLAKLDFMVNFGIPFLEIKQIKEAMEFGGTFE